jgi:plastocyanin
MSSHLKKFAGILPVVIAVAAIGCSSDSSPSGSGGPGGREFVSPTLNQNDSYEHVFNKAGTFHYFCSFHGTSTTGMHGTIVVGAAGTPNKFQDDITNNTLQDFTIELGDTIRWTNTTTIAHNVQSAE